MVTVCWSAARLIRYSFLNPRETVTSETYAQQIDKMHQNRTPAPASLSRKGPILRDNTQQHTLQPASKAERTGLKFCLIRHIHLTSRQPTTMPSSISTTFCRENASNNHQEAENAFQEFTESQSTEFSATGISKLISHWQKCVDCNGSYFD